MNALLIKQSELCWVLIEVDVSKPLPKDILVEDEEGHDLRS